MKLTDITTELVVAEEKITKYLLDMDSPQGRGKAIFLMKFGFEKEIPHILVEALISHAHLNEICNTTTSDYGVKYQIEGPLQAPDNRFPHMTVIWIIKHESQIAQLVTAMPKKGDWT